MSAPPPNIEDVSLSTLRLKPKLLGVHIDDDTPNEELLRQARTAKKLLRTLDKRLKNHPPSTLEHDARIRADKALLDAYVAYLMGQVDENEVIHTDGKRYIEDRWPFPKCICSCGGDGCDFCDGYSCGCRKCERLLYAD